MKANIVTGILLNLPETSFAMKANLVQHEPLMRKHWATAKIYEQIRTPAKATRCTFCTTVPLTPTAIIPWTT